MREKYKELFSPMEIDAIGEIMNISIGSSATAVATLLDRRVAITTPKVDIMAMDEFEFSELEPAVGVEITYVEGLEGKNVMVLKRNDLRNILQILLQTEIAEEDFMMDEMANSAICEIMNQMMGVSSTALSEFLGERVNISIPVSFEIENSVEFKKQYFTSGEPMVIIAFKLLIEDCMESEFMTMMSIALAKRIIASSIGGMEEPVFADEMALPEEKELSVQPNPAPQQAPPIPQAPPVLQMQEIPQMQPVPQAPQMPQMAPVQQAPQMQVPPMQQAPPVQPQYSQPPMQQIPQPQMPPMPVAPVPGMPPYEYYGAPPQYPYPYQPYPPYEQPKVIHADPVKQMNSKESLVESQGSNLDMIMSVPLQLSVEIGRSKKSVKEIIDFAQGSLIVLDKLAGDQADIYVNGQLIAKGDVVVVDDCFGVRITEIMADKDLLLKKK